MDTPFNDLMRIALFTPATNNRWGLPLLFEGPPGIGKSQRIEDAADRNGLDATTLIGSIREPADFGGMPVPVQLGKKTFIHYAPPSWAADLAENGRGLVLVDELTTCPPAVQAAMLRLILNGALGDFELPAGIRFMAACNSVADAAGGWDLAMPLANRFGHFKMPIPDADAWCEWMMGEAGMDFGLDEDGQRVDAAALEDKVRAAWPKAYAMAKGMATSFIRRHRTSLFQKPNANDPRASKAWQSPRSWEAGTRAMAGVAIHLGDPQDRENTAAQVAADELLAAFVGSAAATEFASFRRNVDLPDPEAVLDGRVNWTHDPARLDRTVAVLNSCAALVTAKGKVEDRSKRARKMWEIMLPVVHDAADLAVIPGVQLVRGRAEIRSKEAQETLKVINPVLSASGVNVSNLID